MHENNPIDLIEEYGIGKRILVVDDSRETVKHLVERLLPTYGFESSYALDGRSALEKIRSEQPDLVMLDLNLPEMTGIDVLQALALEHKRPPVVLMTGGGSEQSAVDAFRLGVKDYLVKPFTLDEVLETIQRTLERKGESAETDILPEDDLTIAQNEIRRQKEYFHQLFAISKSITALTDLNTIIDRVLRIALATCSAEICLLWLPSSDQTTFHTYQHTVDTPAILTHSVPIQNKQMTQVLQSGTLKRDTDFSDGIDVGLERKARALLFVPIKTYNSVTGVIGVCNIRAPHAFSEQDELFLTAIAEYASIALSNTYTLQQARHTHTNHIRHLHHLTSLTHALTTQSPTKVIQDALFHICNCWRIEATSVWLVDKSANTVNFHTNIGVGSEALDGMQLSLGEGFAGYTAASGKWIYSNAVAEHPRHNTQADQRTGLHTHSILCLPLIFQNEVLGVLQLVNLADREFNEQDVDQALSIASIIAIAVNNLN